jgi:hypothetical protein
VQFVRQSQRAFFFNFKHLHRPNLHRFIKSPIFQKPALLARLFSPLVQKKQKQNGN